MHREKKERMSVIRTGQRCGRRHAWPAGLDWRPFAPILVAIPVDPELEKATEIDGKKRRWDDVWRRILGDLAG